MSTSLTRRIGKVDDGSRKRNPFFTQNLLVKVINPTKSY